MVIKTILYRATHSGVWYCAALCCKTSRRLQRICHNIRFCEAIWNHIVLHIKYMTCTCIHMVCKHADIDHAGTSKPPQHSGIHEKRTNTYRMNNLAQHAPTHAAQADSKHIELNFAESPSWHAHAYSFGRQCRRTYQTD